MLPVWLLTNFVVNVAWVQGDSMNPTLQTGDVVVLLKYQRWLELLGLYSYGNGDIVIFKAPSDSPYAYEQGWFGLVRSYNIKRIVGLPQQKLAILNGNLFVNRQLIKEKYISVGYMNDLAELTVPKRSLWLLGDNRRQGSSIDSRAYGAVNFSDVAGAVTWRIWPRWGKL